MTGDDDGRADVEALVCRVTGADAVELTEVVQRLWSGYGRIVRCRLDSAATPSVIVKRVRWPDHHDHPRGWASDRSHERKLRSYQVETAWYEGFAARCPEGCRVPRCLAVESRDDGVVLVLEDLDAAGYGDRRQRLDDAALDACLRWLATFHATFLGDSPDGLWPTGTYWHLDTRPDELAALEDEPLREAAGQIDALLSATAFPTLVHGDAKVANFCFSSDGSRVAAVDFQYVGGGCGMKDLAYFVGSCLGEDESERKASAVLDRYFAHLRKPLFDGGVDLDALEADWRALYPVAWTDFHRFLKGWSPGHWKLTDYSERVARSVVAALEAGASTDGAGGP